LFAVVPALCGFHPKVPRNTSGRAFRAGKRGCNGQSAQLAIMVLLATRTEPCSTWNVGLRASLTARTSHQGGNQDQKEQEQRAHANSLFETLPRSRIVASGWSGCGVGLTPLESAAFPRRTPLADSRFLFERRHGLSPLFHSELQEDVLHAREHSRQTRASESDDEAPRAQVVRHVHQGIHSEATGGAQSRQASPLLLRRRSARASDASPGVPRRRKRLPAP